MKQPIVIALAVGLLALACGRSELELGDPDETPVGTGTAGTGTSTGAAGTTGVAGRGAAGTTGAAGRGTAGTTGVAGRGAAGTTGAAGRGAAGTTGAAGRPGPPPMPIPCGASSCVPGKEKCCINVAGGPTSTSCIPLPQSCDGGPSLECIDTPSCGPGRGCCLVTSPTPSTTCATVIACFMTPGLILCNTAADCPPLLGNCCGFAALKTCQPQACGGGGPIPP